jgi:uncharacterized phiE125 gp8 family phage protein
MGLELIRPPAPVEPITLEDAKAALRVDHADEDDLIASFLAAAREWVEERIQFKLAQQTYEFVIDAFPTDEIKLPFIPVAEVVSIKYDDTDGNEQTLASNSYELDSTSRDAWIFSEDAWPSTLDAFNAVRIRFVVGYEDVSLIPQPVIASVILKLKELYDGEDNANAIHSLLTNYYRMVA